MNHDVLFWMNMFWVVLCAAAFGSFANVLIYRLPRMLLGEENSSRDKNTFNIAVPASFCPQCQHAIQWWLNIPLLSFIYLRGQCAYCHQPIPMRYFLVELGTVLWALLSVFWFGLTWQALSSFVFFYVLWVASWIDALYFLLPDVLNYVLLGIGLVVAMAFAHNGVGAALVDALSGAALGYVILWIPYFAYLKWRGLEGLGLGDCKLLASIGCWQGMVAVPNVLLFACVLALIFGVLVAFLRHHSVRTLKIPFGPFISAGAVIQMVLMHSHFKLFV
ncbi:MAG: pppA [Burkholderiaceae bacterium]|nr:pppA [Burkholderiaceae bacterium]